MSDTAIEIQNLRVVRGGRPVLDGISLQVASGSVTGLLGPSGCGKSTLMRAIVGVQIVEGVCAGDDVKALAVCVRKHLFDQASRDALAPVRLGDHEGGEERLDLPVAERLREPDDRLAAGERDQAHRARRGERPPCSLLILRVRPALGDKELEHIRQMLALERSDLDLQVDRHESMRPTCTVVAVLPD